MPFKLEDLLVVGISSSALFDTRREHEIYVQRGVREFVKFQIDNEENPFPKGTAYPLIEAMLRLNQLSPKQLVEVVLLSQNNPVAGLRMMNSIDHYSLPVTRAAFLGGTSVAEYLDPYHVTLFLSRHEQDVRQALTSGVAAGLIYDPPEKLDLSSTQLRIAFDGDAVIFSDESERIYQEQGIKAFFEHEKVKAHSPLLVGPFGAFLKWVARVQNDPAVRNKDGSVPIRTALVTARNAPAHKRVILTLRAWGVEIDEMFFLGGIAKDQILKRFRPHIFFDDQDAHVRAASVLVPSARVVSGIMADAKPQITTQVARDVVTVVTATEATPAAPIAPSSVPVTVNASHATKKVFDLRCREIFGRYTPLRDNGRLGEQFRKFIADNRERPPAERQNILRELERYDLSSLETHNPMLNRELGDTLSKKLEQISRAASEAMQGKLPLDGEEPKP
jgi:5'-nucleotidase